MNSSLLSWHSSNDSLDLFAYGLNSMDYKPQIGGKQCSSLVSPPMEVQVQRLRGQDWHSTHRRCHHKRLIIIEHQCSINFFVILHHVPRFMMRSRYSWIYLAHAQTVCTRPTPAQSARKIGTGDEATACHKKNGPPLIGPPSP